MKFVHIADMHFDCPFSILSKKESLADLRRMEQRNCFRKVIDYIIENKIEYFFIAGDLYENEYVSQATIEFINNEFKKIPNTKVFITPGNHDPYIKGSYYDKFNFANNVYIFKNEEIEIYQDDNINLYGMAFKDFYLNKAVLENIPIVNNGLPNILIAHCDLDGVKDKFGYSYNPILESRLEEYKFNYSAIGHIHKRYIGNNNIVYPGATISHGFDELGSHGMIVGEINNNITKVDFVELDEREFVEMNFDSSNVKSQEELVEKLLNLNLDLNNIYKIVLVGIKNFEININLVLNLISSSNILKIKDLRRLNYDIEQLKVQNSLKGVFVKKLIEKLNNGECSKEEFDKALEIGLSSM